MPHKDNDYIDGDDEDDNKRLVSNDSTCTFSSENSTGQFTITRTLDDRKKSNFYSDVVITRTQYRTNDPDAIFNDFGSQEIRKASSGKARFAVIIVVILLIVMGVLIVASRLFQTGDNAATNSAKIAKDLEYNISSTVHVDLNQTLENSTTILT